MSKTIQMLLGKDEQLLVLQDDGAVWALSEYRGRWNRLPEVRETTEAEMKADMEAADRLAKMLHGGSQ